MHLGAHPHGEVERGRAHPAADADDQAALARRQPGSLEHPPGREGGERVGGALLPAPARRDGRTRLRAGTTTRSAWPPHRCSPRIWKPRPSGASSPWATIASIGATAGFTTTSSPGRPAVDPVADLLDDAGHVAARHVGQRRPGLARG